MDQEATERRNRVSRRKFVKGATATTGALAASTYIKPQLRGLGIPGAHAAVSEPPEEPPPPPPKEPYGKVPSHAIFLVDCGGKRYGLKLDGTSFDRIGPPQDRALLSSLGFSWQNPTSAIKAKFSGHGGPGMDGSGERALVLTIPSGCSLVSGSAFTFDGGLQHCGNGDKYQAAVSSGGTIYFYGACHE